MTASARADRSRRAITLTGQVGIVHGTAWDARLVQVVTASHWNHSVIAISDTHCISAEPGAAGARIRPISHYEQAGEDIEWSRFPLRGWQRRKITGYAIGHIGTPYNWADFFAAGVASILKQRTPRWLDAFVGSTDRLICSQICDLALQAGGIHLFRDERPVGAVTPASFGAYFKAHGWSERA